MKKPDCCELILNHACDLSCAFCSQADFAPSSVMKAADAVRHIYLARKAGFRRLGFSGGEALLRRDLPQLVRAARGVGFKAVRLQTNGMRLADKALAGRLVRAGLTVCKFTFAGHKPAVHDRLVGRAGAFEKSLAGLENMLGLNAAVSVNLIVTRANYRSLPDAVNFFMKEGVPSFVIIYPIYTGAMARAGRLRLPLPQAAPYITAALRAAADGGLGREVKALNVPPCLLPGFESRAAGIYRFDTVVVGADGNSRDLDESVALTRRQGPRCAGCHFAKSCRGVDAGYLARYGWKGLNPVKGKPAGFKAAPGVFLTNNEKCFIEVLKAGGELSTAGVLKGARGVPLCYDCADGNSVLVTGQALERRGLVARRFSRGAYYWRLADA